MTKRTRDAVKTRTHILNVAFAEVMQRGFQGASVNVIIDKTEMTKGAFFHHFSTKQDLGYAIADEIVKSATLSQWIAPLVAYKNPAFGILKVLKKFIDSVSEEEIAAGCALNNLIQEMSSVDPIFRDKLRGILELWIDGLDVRLRRGQVEGFIKRNVDTRQIAEFIVAVHEGGFAIAKSTRDRRIWRSLYGTLSKYLESISSSAAGK